MFNHAIEVSTKRSNPGSVYVTLGLNYFEVELYDRGTTCSGPEGMCFQVAGQEFRIEEYAGGYEDLDTWRAVCYSGSPLL